MTVKMKNMIQNRFFIEKYAILGMKMSKNEIWKYLKAIYLNIKNVLKMFWMRFLLQGASLSIITQTSPICQKFLTPSAPSDINFDRFLKSVRKLDKISIQDSKFA